MLHMMFPCSPLRIVKGSLSENNVRGQIMLEKNGKATDSFPGDVTTERITALQVFPRFHFHFALFMCKTILLKQLNYGTIVS